MGDWESHEGWKSHIFIEANLMCREMVGTDNKLPDELRHIQVWIVLTGYWEAVSSLDLVPYHLTCLILSVQTP